MSFTARRQVVEHRMRSHGQTDMLSLARRRLGAALNESVATHVRGACLDVGAGLSPYAAALALAADSVTTVDIEDRSGAVDVLADIQDMPAIPSESFDSVLCTQVLEHVPEPHRAMTELARVLRPGGTLILSVPHLSAIHEAPHDYFRYTRYGLESLCRSAGFDVVDIAATAGLVAFVGHGVSVALMTVVGSIPGLFHPARLLNYGLLVLLADPIDRVAGLRGRYPCDYVLVATKEPHR